MPDNIEQIIRRDLDQLPVLPAEQWIPQSPGRFTVLGRGVKRAALGAVVLVLALAAGTAIGQFRAGVSGVPRVATQPQRTEPIARCSDGRPQSEIDFAGRMLWEPTATEISCVLNATVSGPGANRAYRLTDGRVLNMYERVEAVPVKPTVAPVATGSADVNGATWSWSTLPAGVGQTLLLQGSLAGAPDIELSMALSDQAADLRLLQSIAASLREVATSTRPPVVATGGPSVLPSATPESTRTPSDPAWQQLRQQVAPTIPIIEPTWMPDVFSSVRAQISAVSTANLASTTYAVRYQTDRDTITFSLGDPAPSLVGMSAAGITVRRSPAVLSFPSDLFAHPGDPGLRAVSWTEGAYLLRIESRTISGDDLLHIAWSLDQTGAPGPGPAVRTKPGACADAVAPETTIRRLIALAGSHDLDSLADCFAFQGGSAGAWADLPTATVESIRLVQGAGGRRQLQPTWTFSAVPAGASNQRQTVFLMVGRDDGLWRIFDANTAPFPTPP
jgi:hypothetical protein